LVLKNVSNLHFEKKPCNCRAFFIEIIGLKC
jgi:hypothetical protein